MFKVEIMLTLTEISSSKLDSEITEFAPIECLDCDFDGHIPITYYLVKPGIEKEEQHLQLKKLVADQLGFNSFAEMGCQYGHLISVCRCPRCGSEEIIQDF